jgi:ABC-type transport system substrate-binding protein
MRQPAGTRHLLPALGVLLALTAAGCGRPAAKAVALRWLVGRAAPRFDPDGPPEAGRWSLERLITRGLVDEDSSGRIVPAAAERIEYARDSLTVTFHLRRDLRFTNGERCDSRDFRAALESGLRREDHSTAVWALSAIRGVDAVRVGKRLPALGIVTPDESTLVVELVRPDPQLLRKLALPGIGAAWAARSAAAGWGHAIGIGPYRVGQEEIGRRLVLVRAGGTRPGPRAGPDTITIRFAIGAARARAALRAGAADLLWPVPPGLLDEPLPAEYRVAHQGAAPPRRLVLVMRADLPPTSKVAARAALAHGINRSDLPHALGPGAREARSWFAGGPPFDFPSLDAREVADWLERGKLGRSFHAVMLFDGDGSGAAIARQLQGEWARLNLYMDLLPLRDGRFSAESAGGAHSHLALVEWQALVDDPVADLAALVMPLRGPAVGAVRTGWRTREFDAWLRPRRRVPPLDPAAVQARLEQELVVLPLADLDWVWVERRDHAGVRAHPHFGPDCGGLAAR